MGEIIRFPLDRCYKTKSTLDSGRYSPLVGVMLLCKKIHIISPFIIYTCHRGLVKTLSPINLLLIHPHLNALHSFWIYEPDLGVNLGITAIMDSPTMSREIFEHNWSKSQCLLKSWTSTSNFRNSTGSFVTSGLFSPVHWRGVTT